MLKNYFKIAWRNLSKNSVYSVINVAGLAIGVAAVVLLFSLIHFELSYDTFHEKHERIYRIVRTNTYADGNVEHTSGAPLAMVDALPQDIPQFEKVVPLCGTIEPQITVLGNDPKSTNTSVKFNEDKQGICAGPEFFDVFDYQWLIGTPQVLKEPNVVVLTKKYANKYFGNYTDAVGKYVKVNNVVTMRVAGILEDIPLNTDFPVNILFSYESKRKSPATFGFGTFDNWGSTSSMDNIYVLLPKGFSAENANKLLKTFGLKHYTDDTNDKKQHSVVALSTVHYDDRYGNFSDRVVSKNKLIGVALVGVLIILMACINFINISTAIASKRAKEVGVRKTLGSANRQLVSQFMIETVVVVGIAIGLGLALASMALPLLTQLFDFPSEARPFSEPILWVFVGALFLVINILSGIYPASILSSFSPLDAFRQKAKTNWTGRVSLRQGLIVFQFTIALVMIFGTIVNFQQMEFISKMDLGFKKTGVYTLAMDVEYRNRYDLFRNRLKQLSEVEAVSFSSDEPSSENNWQTNFSYDNSPKDAPFNSDLKLADGDYAATYGLKIIAGSPYLVSDTLRKIIVNETILKKLNVKNPELAIGKMIRIGGWDPAPIVAVVKDFQVGTARDAIRPVMIAKLEKYHWRSGIKITSANLTETVAKIEKIYSEVFPEVVFNGNFYEDKLEKYYKTEQQLGLLYRIASMLSVFIACLGVFGLVTFVAEQRVKEIGIRKVLGATVSHITLMISKDFIKLVVVSMFIAFPVAYYLMKQWLDDFVYRTTIEWWYFIVTGVIALVITFASVSYQSIRAALTNPVKSLKSE